MQARHHGVGHRFRAKLNLNYAAGGREPAPGGSRGPEHCRRAIEV